MIVQINDVAEVAQSTTHKAFLEVFYRGHVVKHGKNLEEFELLESDRNNTGYFDGLVSRNLRQPIGTLLRTTTAPGNNRRVLVIVTPVGNVVLFERYTNGEKGAIVCNCPRSLRGLMPSGAQTSDSITSLTGGAWSCEYQNIGYDVKSILADAAAVNFDNDELFGDNE